MKIEHVTCIWMFVYEMIFEFPEMAQKWSFGFFRPNLPQLGLFHPYFVSKSCFRVISMIKIVILDQSKQISLILKKLNQNFKNQKFVHSTFIIYKNGNKTSIQPILISNFTSFMFNNIFCELKGKKVIHLGGGGNTKSYATGKPMLQTLPNFMNMFTKLYTIIICKKNASFYH